MAEKKIEGLSLKWKLIGTNVILVLVLGIIAVFVVNRQVSFTLGEELAERGRTIATNTARGATADAIARSDIPALGVVVRDAGQLKAVSYVVITDAEGKVLAFSGVDDSGAASAAESNVVSLTDEPKTQERTELAVLDIAAPSPGGGVVHIGMDTSYISAQIWGVMQIIILAVAIVVVVGAGVGFLMGGRLSGQLVHLSEVADRVSMGELDASIDIESKDEVGVLASSFDRLRMSLKAAMSRLAK
jgi:methyl-accepting chemotaxis protein